MLVQHPTANFNIIVNKLENDGGNPVFQSLKKAISYQVTQGYIVSKKYFYKIVLSEIEESFENKKKLSILELGVGAGDFLEQLITSNLMNKFEEINFYGVDISDTMISLTKEAIEKNKVFLKEGQNAVNINIYLTSGVNLVDKNSPYYIDLSRKIEKNGKFDVILAFQFEHYFPNSTRGRLADVFYHKKKFFEKI